MSDLTLRDGKLILGPHGIERAPSSTMLPAPEGIVSQMFEQGQPISHAIAELSNLVEGADGYTAALYDSATNALIGTGSFEGTDNPAILFRLPAVASPVLRRYTIMANPSGEIFQGTFLQVPAVAVTVLTNPVLVFNGGANVGATLTVQPITYEGGTPLEPLVTKLYTSNDDFDEDRVEYGTYTGSLTVPDWTGRRVRAETTVVDINGTTIYVSDPSDVISDETPLPVPAAPTENNWKVSARVAQPPQQATRYVLEYEVSGIGTPVAVQWLNEPIDDFADPETYESKWRPCVLDGDKWVHYTTNATEEWTRINGNAAVNLRMRYQAVEGGPFSPISIDKKVGPSEAASDPELEQLWHTVSLVTDQEYQAGKNAGSGGQPAIICRRADGDPSVIMFGCDINGIFRSEDDGITFRRPAQKGLYPSFTLTMAVDPTDDRVILYAGCARYYTEGASRVGVYRSTDAGESFTPVLIKTNMEMFRRHRAYFIDYDRSKRNTQTPDNRTWLMALPDSPGDVFGSWRLYRSDDGGKSFGSPIFTFSQATYGNINCLMSHPSVAGCFYLCTDKGFFRTTNYGETWTNLTGNINGWASGGTNRVMNVEINPEAGAVASTELYIGVSNNQTQNTGATGVHRSTNGGGAFTKLSTNGNASAVRVAFNSSGKWDAVGSRVMFLIRRGQVPQRSTNGGSSWQSVTVNGRPHANGTIGSNLSDTDKGGANPAFNAELLPHPTNPNIVWGHSASYLHRSVNGGSVFNPTGAYTEMANWQTGHGALAFIEGDVEGADDGVLIGTTDFGLFKSMSKARHFHFSKINYDQPNGVKEDSVNACAWCPDNPDIIIATTGYHNSTSAWMRTNKEFPNNEPSGDWSYLGRTDNYPYFAHWHKSDPSICYASHGRFTNAKVNSAYSAYNGGGYAVEVYPKNNDILYTIVGSGASTKLRKSIDKGASFSDYLTPGWSPARDVRKAMIACDPEDHNMLYMPGPQQAGGNRDLRRYNGNNGTWKSDYNLVARFRADNPDYPQNMAVQVDRIALDPQDRDTLAVSIYALSFSEVYITYNATAANPTWHRITKNLSRLVAPGLKFHPRNGDLWCGFTYGGTFIYPHPDPHPSASWAPGLIVQNVEAA